MAPEKVRVSVGTASVLGLVRYRLDVPPTTAYLMTYTEASCRANCGFCAQAAGHREDNDKLSRVTWPEFPVKEVIEGFKDPRMDVLRRICVQAINYPGFLGDVISLVVLFKRHTGLPISVDTCPLDKADLYRLREAGAEMISIPLDAATPGIFDRIKGRGVGGPYRWEGHMESLRQAVEVFGSGNVGSNLIVGLGETERESARIIQSLHEEGVRVALYAFTPLIGTILEDMPQPSLDTYRRVQVALLLIQKDLASFDEFAFDPKGHITGYGDVDLEEALRDGVAFMTAGCPGCNRPFYNERPSGPLYNYPRPLTFEETRRELEMIVND